MNPAPPPIIRLTAADENKQFLCKNDIPLEAFSCTLHSFNDSYLVWHFNDQEITAFYPARDPVNHDVINKSFPISNESAVYVYNLTAIFTRVTQVPSLSTFDLPFLISESVLIVRPFNESQTEFEPYNVTCSCLNTLGYCTSNNRTVCQTKQYEVAGMFLLFCGYL